MKGQHEAESGAAIPALQSYALGSFMQQLNDDIVIRQIAKRATSDLGRSLGCLCEPQGWRKWWMLAVGLLVFPFVLPPLAAEIAELWPELDGWERARVVLASIYLLLGSVLWGWGVWELFT